MTKKATKKSAVKQRKNSGKVPRGTPFPKGVSGNPKGRPKKENCLTDIMREKLAEMDPDTGLYTRAEWIVLCTYGLALKGNSAALKEVWERMDGKVKEEIEQTVRRSDDSKLLEKAFTLKELKEMRKRMREVE